jgi:hypothetical protein
MVAVFVLLLGACGGGGSKQASSTGTTGQPSATQASSAGGGGGYCALARDYSDRFAAAFQKDFQAALTNPNDAAARDALKRDLQAARNAARDALANAPSQIKADLETVFKFIDPFLTALENANFDFAKLQQSNPNFLKQTQDPNFQAAAQRLSAYARDVCHYTPPST